jgi:hypothetical protein
MKLEGKCVECKWKLGCCRNKISCFKLVLATERNRRRSHSLLCLQHIFLLLWWCLLISLAYIQNLTPTSYKPQPGNCWVGGYDGGVHCSHLLHCVVGREVGGWCLAVPHCTHIQDVRVSQARETSRSRWQAGPSAVSVGLLPALSPEGGGNVIQTTQHYNTEECT